MRVKNVRADGRKFVNKLSKNMCCDSPLDNAMITTIILLEDIITKKKLDGSSNSDYVIWSELYNKSKGNPWIDCKKLGGRREALLLHILPRLGGSGAIKVEFKGQEMVSMKIKLCMEEAHRVDMVLRKGIKNKRKLRPVWVPDSTLYS